MEIKWSGNPNLATLFIGGFRKWYQSISRPEKRVYTDFQLSITLIMEIKGSGNPVFRTLSKIFPFDFSWLKT